MEQRIIEGTWEEVTRHARELAGHRVRVTVLDELSTNDAHSDAEPTAFDVLSKAGLIGTLKGGPSDLATNPAHMEGFGGE
ncbi:hypothetical protein [Aquisphaera insulae]|uniref:hypothetical protein n=1 Tax=Aquisphaera insulae TaxID=2712864 RepID=UPI0013ECEC2B|nr:hypothetical protein [Aquisphaera insulae]